MARNVKFDMVAFAEWLKDRPQVIQEMAAKYPPDRLYNHAPLNECAFLSSYSENGTVSVNVVSEFNRGGIWSIMGSLNNKHVFDVPAESLTERDLPEWYDNSAGEWENTL